MKEFPLEAIEQQQSDAELVGLVVAGQQDAIAEIVRRYTPLVRSVCAAALSDPQTLEDATQDTFLIFMYRASKIRRPSSLAAWLHGVAYRTACRHRSKLIGRRKLSPLDESRLVCGEPPPLYQLCQQLEVEQLHRQIEKLPVAMRTAVVEHHLLGLSLAEAAEKVGCSEAAFEGRVRRGRHRLRIALTRNKLSLTVSLAATRFVQDTIAATPAAAVAPAEHLALNNPRLLKTLLRGEDAVRMLPTSLAATTVLVAGLIAMTLSVGPGRAKAAGDDPFDERRNPSLGDPFGNVHTVDSPADESREQAADVAVGQTLGGSVRTDLGVEGQVVLSDSLDSDASLESRNARVAARTEAESTQRSLIQQQLDALGEFDYVNQPLRTVLMDISDMFGIPFIVDEVNVQMALNSIDEPVTLTGLPNITLHTALDMLLSPREFSYVIKDGGYILIGTKAVSERRYYHLERDIDQSSIEALATILPHAETSDHSVNMLSPKLILVEADEPGHREVEEYLYQLTIAETSY